MKKLFLPLNLQQFAEDNHQGGDDQNNQNNNGDQSSTNSSQNDNMIPYSRFKEVNDNFKSVKDQLDQLLKDKAQAEEEAKKKTGEFETLYNDLKANHDPLVEELSKYKEIFKTILASRLESVPENFRDLIPQGNELDQLKWVENATAKGLFKTNTTQSFGNQGNNPTNDNSVTKDDFNRMTYSERVELYNKNPELYKKLS